MDRKPGNRRPTWPRKSPPGAPNSPLRPVAPKTPYTLGKMWQQEPPEQPHAQPRSREATNSSWLVGEPRAREASPPRQPAYEPMADLPVPPTIPEDPGLAARAANDERLGGESISDERTVPLQNLPDAHASSGRARSLGSLGGQLRALWSKRAPRMRRPRSVRAAVAGVLVLCLVLGVAALGNAFLHGGANSAQNLLGARGALGAVSTAGAKVPAGHATPGATTNATAVPSNTQPPTPLTLAFTCASGVAGGTGKICVHTLPNAALTLTVRYCDGSYARGKPFHGASYADHSGNYTWTWTVTTTCVGATTATVTAKSAGQTATQSTTFAITNQ